MLRGVVNKNPDTLRGGGLTNVKILFIKIKFVKNSLKGLRTTVFLGKKAPGGWGQCENFIH